MIIAKKTFKHIDREYVITSAELRNALNIEGEIMSMGLLNGRSPNEKEKGVSAEEDTWYIRTLEKGESK